MSTSISRRNWLRSTALLATGLVSAPIVASPLLAGPSSPQIPPSIYEKKLAIFNQTLELRARLNANENPFGPSEMVKDGIRNSLELGNRYGWTDLKKLVEMIAGYEGVPATHILIGPGSSYLLEMTAIAHCRKKGNIVSATPTFMSLIRTAMAVNTKWRDIPLTPTYAHDLVAMDKAVNGKTRLVYICNPNNPTGTITPNQNLRDFCSSVSSQTPVFVDEAYIDYLGKNNRTQSMASLVMEGKDVIVARTFSKIHAMAGMRVGYLIAQPHRIRMIQDLVRTVMTLSVSSIHAAMYSLEDQLFIDNSREQTGEVRSFTYNALKEIGAEPIPSYTSFMMFPLKMDGETFIEEMYEKGVAVRLFEMNGQPHCRVSMGTMSEMEYFISTAREVMN